MKNQLEEYTSDVYYLHADSVMLPHGFQKRYLRIENGVIKGIEWEPKMGINAKLIGFGGCVIVPGLIDSHVHINEPGRTDWEGFETATKAAARGGITTLVDMPLNSSPVTTTVAALREKIAAAEGKLHVNVGFYGGIVPGNTEHLAQLAAAGVLGFKAFLSHSGIDEFPNVTREDLETGMPIIAQTGLPLLAHSELVAPHPDFHVMDLAPRSHDAWLRSRPKSWEVNAIEMMIELCRKHNCRTHIVHLSANEGIAPLRDAIAEGLPITVETCPHYLIFAAEDIQDGATIYKCAPPIRERENNEHLWLALKEGLITMVVSDHSPAPPEIKGLENGRFDAAWGGIAGLQYSFAATHTGALQQHRFTTMNVVNWMSANVAKFLGLYDRKGSIELGKDADFTIIDTSGYCETDVQGNEHRHKITPYAGMKLRGNVVATIVGGKIVYQQGQFSESRHGKIILRKEK
jgi:allantoinase